MGRNGHASGQIIANLREVEVSLGKGTAVAEACRARGTVLWARITNRCWNADKVWSPVLDHQAQHYIIHRPDQMLTST